MATTNLENATPVEYIINANQQAGDIDTSYESKIAGYVTSWKRQCRNAFTQRRNIWDECWALYRGVDDWSNKEEWQSKIVLPKSFTSVKMATNAIKRLLSTSKKPWTVESINPEDMVNVLRADQMTDLTREFMDMANFKKEFSEGLECGFIQGLGVWKEWWGLVPRKRSRVQTTYQQIPAPQMGLGQLLNPQAQANQFPPNFSQGQQDFSQQSQSQYPEQLSNENLNPYGWGQGPQGQGMAPQNFITVPHKELIHEEIMEGRLFIRAVDPYNFWWLPGSKLNHWVGTIEEVEIPKWELMRMADAGVFNKKLIERIQPQKIEEQYHMGALRFAETQTSNIGPNNDVQGVKLTEYYGPLVLDGKIVEEHAHIIIANDTVVLVYQPNPFLHKKAPYIGFSPLNLPFRTEGVGLIEMVRHIDKALSHLANLSVDTLVFRLLPLFEVSIDAFENPEDFETGLTPGKILRKHLGHSGIEGIRPVQFQDISSGTTQVWANLDRSHQEGALISDIAEGLPRFRGAQTATETELMSNQSESFMGSMAADIESGALEPMVEMALDLIFQFIDTSNDPRIASILGVGADYLSSMSREEIVEMIQGDYKVKVTGITGQLQKAEMLQNLVQLMNLIGQNPEAWLPYLNQDALLRRILEAFRPTIHDIDNIIADPETAAAKQLEMEKAALAPNMVGMIPQLLQMQAEAQTKEQDAGIELQRQAHEQQIQAGEQVLQNQQIQQQQLAIQAQQAQNAAPQGATK